MVMMICVDRCGAGSERFLDAPWLHRPPGTAFWIYIRFLDLHIDPLACRRYSVMSLRASSWSSQKTGRQLTSTRT